MTKKNGLKSDQPWHLSYKKASEARPSWTKHGMPPLFQKFLKLTKNSNVASGIHLDIGCGNGTKTVNFALAGFSVVGVDISDEGFKEAKKIVKDLGVLKKCKFIKADCLNLPLQDGSVKSVSDLFCFTHLESKDYEKYKNELYRVLQGGSYILIGLFSDKDEHFHGHKISKNYTFKFDPTNVLMEGFSHYHGMYNAHFGEKEILNTFNGMFEVIILKEYRHPIYAHRYLWNIILRKLEM